ncbi:putative bifunctional diguanylate cyclase/phosphodiesterase [Deinococcus planocerae]|uniref:putative bifunctional diguanylate cyclase/phosphodiesterase n=1 Tax=Deinococcus planocerae TaxID=1737569 RepID=UPI0015E14C28|nr:EAL domain-containing protein [Deinococcus planocerae]
MPARPPHPARLGALYLLAWLALDVVSQRFNAAPGVSVWYPPSALDYVLLLVFGLRFWPFLVVSSLLHQALVVEQPLPPTPLLAFLAVTVGGTVLACRVLRGLRFDPRLSRLRDVQLFVVVAMVAAPLAVAALQVLTLAGAGALVWPRVDERILQLWAGAATGTGLLAPPLLLLLRRWPGVWAAPSPEGTDPEPPPEPDPAPPPPRWRRVLGGLAEVGLGLTALWVGYGGPRSTTLDFSYALFVPLLWTATRHGFGRTALAVLGLNVGVALLTGSREVRETGGLALQFGLLTLTVSGLLLGAVLRERRRLTAHLAYLALHDPLTGLGNRRLFQERVARALEDGPAPARVAALLMDLDNFKAINDSLGHGTGDEVLRAVGGRLKAGLPAGATVSRLGGDEFAVLLPGVGGPSEASEAAERLLAALDTPVTVRGLSLNVEASVGIALGGGEDGETLLRNADVALYRAKAERRGRAQLFDASMHAAVVADMELEAELRTALAREDFELRYQPLVDVHTGRARGVEALVRWPHPTRGLLTPEAFLGVAEETGLVVPLGRWVLRAACREVAGWTGAPGEEPPSVGVNLTAAHLAQADVVEDVAAALREAGLAPGRLMVELTENVLMSDVEATLHTLGALRDLGVRLAVDDFGTGYSSLSYLRHFPIDDLKVDRSFIAGLGHDKTGTELARVIAVLGHTLGLNTVAEGVETADQYAEVRALGYAMAQGYYIAHPLPAAEARALLAQEEPLVSRGT